jgi:5-aminopentanamidase
MIRVACLELAAAFGNPTQQLEMVSAELSKRPPCDLVVLPECALTGYVSPTFDFDLRPFAEPSRGHTYQTLSQIAAREKVALVGGFVEQSDDHFFNLTVGFSSEGAELFRYRKRHPWYPETWATASPASIPLFQLNDMTLSCAVCFDVHFLANDSSEQLHAADALLFPSAWVDDEDTRGVLLREVATTFHLAIVNANWGVGQPALRGQGDSMVLSARGDRIETRGGPWVTAQIERTFL